MLTATLSFQLWGFILLNIAFKECRKRQYLDFYLRKIFTLQLVQTTYVVQSHGGATNLDSLKSSHKPLITPCKKVNKFSYLNCPSTLSKATGVQVHYRMRLQKVFMSRWNVPLKPFFKLISSGKTCDSHQRNFVIWCSCGYCICVLSLTMYGDWT